MNPLDKYPRVRAYLYLIQWIVNGLIAVLTAVFTFQYGLTEIDQWPQWFLGIIAVAPVLWTYLGLTAQQNTPAFLTQPTYTHEHTGGGGSESSIYGQTDPMYQPGSDEDGFGGDAPPPGSYANPDRSSL